MKIFGHNELIKIEKYGDIVRKKIYNSHRTTQNAYNYPNCEQNQPPINTAQIL